MIVIRSELWPHGDESQAKPLGTCVITNDGTGTPTRGRYDFLLQGRRNVLETGRVADFPRTTKNVWHLLQRVLKVYAPLLLVAVLMSGCATLSTRGVSPTLRSLSRLEVMEPTEEGDWEVYGETHASDYARLVAWAEDHHIVVAEASLQRKTLLGHSSRSSFLGWIVLVDRDMSGNNKLYTLVHELGHVYEPSGTRTVQESETIAELVAVQVCDRLGVNVWRQTAAYLRAHVTLETQRAVVARWGTQIDQIVETLK